MFSYLFVLSIAPFAVFLILLLWKKTSLLLASVTTLVLTALVAVFFWQILPSYILFSFIKGSLIAFDIFVIIFGAVFFLEILKSLKIIENIGYYLESFSKDYRVQIILLAWFFENFLEGTAGFGTPCVVVAPVLVSLGLTPVTAVIISLLGNSTAGAFGAAGTPIRVGFAGLDTTSVPLYTAFFNCVGFLVPVFMLWVLVVRQKRERREFFEGLAFAIWSGIAFVVPSILMTFLGQEFPSILGSLLGLSLVIFSTKLGLFLPKNIRSLNENTKSTGNFSLFKDFFPYALLIVFLILGKLFFGSINIKLFGMKYLVNLFNPGLAFIIAGIPTAIIWGRQKSLIGEAAKVSLRRTIGPFLVIISVSSMVQIMINTGQNNTGFPSALELIAKSFEVKLLPFFAPFIGAFGSFITGSVTISNVMFGSFLNTASRVLNLESAKVLALGLAGAAAGNMIALADMLSAETVVGLKNEERQILKGVIVPCIIYIVIVGLLGLLVTSSL